MPGPRLAPSRIPAALTSFVGRDRELEGLTALLAGSRLVTLVGPGGAGKTRLSVEALTRQEVFRRGRVSFVSPGSARPTSSATPCSARSAPGTSVCPTYGRRRSTPARRVAELIGAGEVLLLLDNCEHLVEAAAEFAYGLLEELPQLRILATTREALAVTGEALCRLGPLDVPSGTPDPAERLGRDRRGRSGGPVRG
ncbi:hypothetical protein [Streptomyces sp. NPDC055134]